MTRLMPPASPGSEPLRLGILDKAAHLHLLVDVDQQLQAWPPGARLPAGCKRPIEGEVSAERPSSGQHFVAQDAVDPDQGHLPERLQERHVVRGGYHSRIGRELASHTIASLCSYLSYSLHNLTTSGRVPVTFPRASTPQIWGVRLVVQLHRAVAALLLAALALIVFALAFVGFLILAALAAEWSFFEHIWNSRGVIRPLPREGGSLSPKPPEVMAAREIYGGR